MFRSSENAKLAIIFPNNKKSIIHLREPSLIALKSSVISILPSDLLNSIQTLPFIFYVIRENKKWILQDDRDIEELEGKYNKREVIYLAINEEHNTIPLRYFPLPRSWIKCLGPAPNILTITETNINGEQIMKEFQNKGYIRIQFSQETTNTIKQVFNDAKIFFKNNNDIKNKYNGSTTRKLAPFYGYRSTSLSKEFFVYRPNSIYSFPDDLSQLIQGYEKLLKISKIIMWEILLHLGWTEEIIQKHLNNLNTPINDSSILPFTSFIEIFKYNCNPGPGVELSDNDKRYRISCGEHRDTGLLTIIPKCIGSCEGLEVYNWNTSEWHCEELDMKENEGIIFPGELFAPFTNSNLPALCHRVVIPLIKNGVRYSCPFELLPIPSEKVRNDLSDLAKGLISANH